MNRAMRKLIGLFVDDGSFAAAILIWLVVAGLWAKLGTPDATKGPLLFAGLALILVGSAARGARR